MGSVCVWKSALKRFTMQGKPLCKLLFFTANTVGWSVSFNLGNVVKLCRNTGTKGDKSISTVIPNSHFSQILSTMELCWTVVHWCQAIVCHQHLHSCYCFTAAAATQTCDGVGGRHSRVTLALCYTKETCWDNSPLIFSLYFKLYMTLIQEIFYLKYWAGW